MPISATLFSIISIPFYEGYILSTVSIPSRYNADLIT